MGARWNPEAIGEAFAAAAVDPSRWVAAMDTVAAETGSVGALLIPGQGGTPPIYPVSESIGLVSEAYFRDGWVYRDERYRGISMLQTRGVFGDLEFTNPEEIRRHPYYQEFLAPHGLRWFAGVKVAAGDDLWVLSIQRTIEQGPFSLAQQRDLARLSKRLSSAAALAHALGFARAEAALAAFDASGRAAILFDRFGRVFRVNAAAEELTGSDLQIVQKQIVCRDRVAQSSFARALHDVLWSGAPASLMAPLALPRQNKRPLLAYLARLSGVSADAFAPCQAIAVLIDLEHAPRPPESVLRSTFRLTAAEARLAMHFASGRTLEGIADDLGIAYETARNQLKVVFAKTGTHRQAELVALLARMLPGSPASSL